MNSSIFNGGIVRGSVDTHQHFWRYHPQRHSWINDEMATIRKDFMPEDLQPVLNQNGIAGCIAVQADQTEAETNFLLQLAAENNFIKGVVGWVDLRTDNTEARLEHFAQFTLLKGFRHILQAEQPAFMLQPGFLQGIGLLSRHQFTYDLLIFPNHLSAALQLVKQFPHQPFVIDHIAKPAIREGLINEWKKDITALAGCSNVCCKISGLVTEADMRNWKPRDFKPYLDTVIAAFGIDRVMFGSDWPVCLAVGAYRQVMDIVKDYFAAFSLEEQRLFFGGNATAFYHLI